MARAPSFNFGANKKPRGKKPAKGRGSKKPRSTRSAGKSNAWRAYISNAPIPD